MQKRDLTNIVAIPVFFTSLKDYNRQKFIKDLGAGISVSIIALPLAIAFGIASGVTPEQGIITSIIGGFLASMFGGSNYQITGATGAFIVTVYGVVHNFGVEGLALTTAIAGIMLLLMGVLKIGVLIKFIPYPIIVGFTSGIAVTIFASQLSEIFGLGVNKMPVSFIEKISACANNASSFDPWTLAMTVATILIINSLRRISKKIPAYLITLIIVSVITIALTYFFGITSIETIGDRFNKISAELPTPQQLNFDSLDFSVLFSSAFTIAMLGAIVSLLSATVAEGISGEKYDPNSELIGQGIANFFTPFFGGIPATGAVARTVTNIRHGARTPVSGLAHSATLLLILLFLGSMTSYIPMSALAGILVIVSHNMADWKTFRSLLKNPAGDVAVLLTTFFLTIFVGLTVALEVGMVLAVVSFVKRFNETSRISISTGRLPGDETNDIASSDRAIILKEGIDVYEIEGAFSFGMANKFDTVTVTVSKRPKVRIIRMRHVPFIDSTGIHNLRVLIERCRKERIHILVSGMQDSVYQTLEATGLTEYIGKENIFKTIHDALAAAEILVHSREE